MVQLLLKGALRIQDIVGPTFKDLKQCNPNENGCRVMHFKAKKSSSRSVLFDKEVYDAVIDYQRQIKAKDEDVMFPPGCGTDPVQL